MESSIEETITKYLSSDYFTSERLSFIVIISIIDRQRFQRLRVWFCLFQILEHEIAFDLLTSAKIYWSTKFDLMQVVEMKAPSLFSSEQIQLNLEEVSFK